jgi:hypothetical protein
LDAGAGPAGIFLLNQDLLVAGDIGLGATAYLYYLGGQWLLLNPQSSGVDASQVQGMLFNRGNDCRCLRGYQSIYS